MSADVVFEIARFDGERDDALLLQRIQLLSIDGGLRLRGPGGIATPCEEADIASAISSRPSLREIRAEEHIRISCGPEIVARLPLVLKPVLGGYANECLLEVNGEIWAAYPTSDDEYVVLPRGGGSSEPEMSPCWAEYAFEEEGGWSEISLIGSTSIGLATPDVVVKYARYDYGWGREGSVVAVGLFDDFAGVFVDWLEDGYSWLLGERWVGKTAPCCPGVPLFAEAAAAVDRTCRWITGMDGESRDEDEHNEEIVHPETSAADLSGDAGEDEEGDASGWARGCLELHLSDELIERVWALIRQGD